MISHFLKLLFLTKQILWLLNVPIQILIEILWSKLAVYIIQLILFVNFQSKYFLLIFRILFYLEKKKVTKVFFIHNWQILV